MAEHIDANTRSIHADADFIHTNIDIVQQHLMRFPNEAGDLQAINKVIIERSRDIADGKIEATPKDEAFLTHEMREAELMNGGMDYDTAHAQACKEYGVTGEMEKVTNNNTEHVFYTEEALQADALEQIQ